jgi:hypothetical protein
VTYRFSQAGLRTAAGTLLFGSTLLLVPLAPAEAAPVQQDRARSAAPVKTTKLAEVDPATTSSLSKAAGEEEPGCNRPRRRLWVEGEGWVVRRVSACH